MLRKRRNKVVVACFAVGLLYWLFCLPEPLFPTPQSTQLLSVEGELLSARIAADGQWRMPAADSISPKLVTSVVGYEDRRFYQHWGVSLAGIVRAIRDNWRAGKIVSGGSTITMQVARMARGNRARTLVQKAVEGLWATRLEVKYSKAEILRFWLANAPFGGNVVGVEAAGRRYYGRSPADLSWAEAATLAVLPNSPALIHPGRARAALKRKRDALLDDLVDQGSLNAEEAELAKLEPLPDKPKPLPREADHLLERLRLSYGSGRYHSSIEAALQRQVTELVRRHQSQLAGSQIHNVAAMVTEVSTGRVLAYVGNAPGLAPAHAPAVDIITAARSPGSLLKPILYGLAMEQGMLTPRQLLKDVPTNFSDFHPSNFYQDFDGAVPADEALARSLNIPFVFLLQAYGVAPFHASLREYGFEKLTQRPDHYGLSLILGGGETSMEEIQAWWLGMARQQRYFHERQGQYARKDFARPSLLDKEVRDPLVDLAPTPGNIGAGAGFLTLKALTALSRPDETGAEQRFRSHRPIAWKTGTSFGFRDAWAAGSTPAYVVSVWAGNADGEGRAGLVGVKAAAPLLFQIFRLLEERPTEAPVWFEQPWDDMREVNTCEVSGLLASPDCPGKREWISRLGERAPSCSYHKRIFTDTDRRWQLRQGCGEGPILPSPWFQLPTRQAHFYRRRHPNYSNPPTWHPSCRAEAASTAIMQFIYPNKGGALSPSKNWLGEIEGIFFELAHSKPEATVYWHLDEQYLGETSTFHSMAVQIPTGKHRISVVDEKGNRLEKSIIVK